MYNIICTCIVMYNIICICTGVYSDVNMYVHV